VPREDEWKELEQARGMPSDIVDSLHIRGNYEGSKLAGNAELWQDDNGSDESEMESNAHFGTSGFSALPGGCFRNCVLDEFCYFPARQNAFWWSSTEASSDKSWCRFLLSKSTWSGKLIERKTCGFSVRCVRD
jgi:uncharacterized protein (TIGR02145 family)